MWRVRDRVSFLLFVFFLVNSIAFVLGAEGFSRQDFPHAFVFGAATSAHHVEGAANEDGKTPSIWDTSFDATGGTAEVACDQYHKYKEDVQLIWRIQALRPINSPSRGPD